MIRTLRSKIFAFSLALLLLVMALVLVLVDNATRAHTEAQIADQLENGLAVVRNDLQVRELYVVSTAGTFTRDFNLIEQINSRDANSIAATLESYRGRASADFALALNVDGQVMAATQNGIAPDRRLPFGLKLPRDTPQVLSTVVVARGGAYQVFAWPLFAPEPDLVAWLVMGFRLDDTLATRLRRLTGLDVSLLADGQVLASSLPPDVRRPLAAQTAPAGHGRMRLDGRDFVVYTQPLGIGDAPAITVLLQRSLTEAMREYRVLQLQIVAIQIGSLILAALGAFFIANTVSRPLSRMSEYAKRIAHGEYREPPAMPEHGEVGVLAREFSTMQRRIAEREAAVRHLAYNDPLTELPNRNAFQASLGAAIAGAGTQGGHMAVLVLDIDYFKDINDTLGHLTGDLLLKQFAARLQAVRTPEQQLARLGGDQFAVLLPAGGIDAVTRAAEQYREAWRDPFTVEGFTLGLSARLGIAVYPEHGENAVTLLQRAEVAMYVSKRQKKPYSFYDTQLDHNSVLRLALMSELRGAIDRGELVLYYQPKYDLTRDAVTGVECLVRWMHPVHGLIPPDHFIGLAEQTGNIRYLTRWAVHSALARAAEWRMRGMPLRVAVNISAVDLSDPQLPTEIAQTLAAQALPSDVLMLEITESAVMADPAGAVRSLTQLQDMGVRLSIDDYGTGYSSMAQLKRLPVHELKIDKSFVLDVANNPDDAIIVRSTIELGHNMGLVVVAEGVENHETRELLRALGCDVVQGYYLSKPLPAADFERWLAASAGGGRDQEESR